MGSRVRGGRDKVRGAAITAQVKVRGVASEWCGCAWSGGGQKWTEWLLGELGVGSRRELLTNCSAAELTELLK